MSIDKLDYEALITRRLDGAISNDEALRLDRELLRNPELRETFDAYTRNDAIASEALSRQLGAGCGNVDISAITEERAAKGLGRPHRGWLLIPGAIAAALLAMVIPMPSFTNTSQPRIVDSYPDSTPMHERGLRPVSTLDGLYRNANTTKRNTGRDVIGVIGEDGNMYWIEVDRTRTITVPPRSPLETDQRL